MNRFKRIVKNIKKNGRWYRRIILFLFFGSIAGVYFHNVTRDVYSGDIGDLVTAAWVFGVAHPPGYPLFTFLGYLFMHYIPGSLPPVTKMGFISVIASLVGLIYIYKFANRVTKSLYLSLLSTSILGFSYLYWIQAEIPEVFALNNLFVILILYYSILFYEEKKPKHLYLLVFLCGLSLTHHQTILFIFPSVLLLVVRHFKFVFWNWKRLLIMTGLFVLGLLPYIYVPIAASHNPVVNWNNASNLKNFLHLIKRDNYGGFAPGIMGVLVDVKLIFIINYFNNIIANFSYQIIAVALLGMVYLFRKKALVFFALLVGFILTGVFFVFYGASYVYTQAGLGIIERFYGTSAIVLMLFMIYGFYFLHMLLNKFLTQKIYVIIFMSYFLIVPFFLIYYNYPRAELNRSNIGNNLIEDMYAPIVKNGVVVVAGDTIAFNSWYMRYALGFRKDTEIVNSAGVGSNYFMNREVRRYVDKYKKVPLDTLYYNTMEDLRKKRSIYVLTGSEYIAPSAIVVPKGLVGQIYSKKDVPSEEKYIDEINKIISNYRIPKRDKLEPYNDNLIATEIPTAYADALIEIGNFITTYYKDPIAASDYYQKALLVDDEYHLAYYKFGINQYESSKDCNGSIESINKAIDLFPIKKDYYLDLYSIYNKCGVKEERKKILKERYEAYINKNFDKEIKTHLK